MTHGHCLCGALQYEIEGPFSAMGNCHCSMCRKQHGTNFATYVVVPMGALHWVDGEEHVSRFQSSADGTRAFCAVCGSVAPSGIPEIGIAFAPAGNLQGALGIKPQYHMFVGSKAPWYTITDKLPQYEAYPPKVDARGVDRPKVAKREGLTDGSCLCGEIGFEITGVPQRAMNCHCTRCQRGRSAAHASNLMYGVDQFRWIRGKDLIREYKIPDARFHTVAFCMRCGSKVPRISAERGIVIVPAGSLDTDPGMRPAAHIFVADKAAWFEITDSLPQYPQMPPA